MELDPDTLQDSLRMRRKKLKATSTLRRHGNRGTVRDNQAVDSLGIVPDDVHIYVEAPPEAGLRSDQCWRLRKAMNGLR
eukprot:6213300-Amphidinium_carterae.1